MAKPDEGGTLEYYTAPRYEPKEDEVYQVVERKKPTKDFKPKDNAVYECSQISIDDCIAMFKQSEKNQ